MSAKEKSTRVFILSMVAAFVLSSLGFSALVIWTIVKGDDQSSQTADVQKQLQDQLNQQKNKLAGKKLSGFTPVKNVGKLKIIDLKKGTGRAVKTGDTVTAHYTGAVASTGIIFQSSHDSGQPVPFQLKKGALIKGWLQGVPGMKAGGTRRLIIPANLAYGAHPPQGSNIPANAPLVFDIELVKIN
ncbi:MAG TPA: FKBP-type peptidyl-prolyl cis-trans isomerase [Candidatus Saccharimonadales bacterium]|nr:FKBP-type peptidyl-prolyl cis-trans isomerase [Candidatus Saccharimonadales bacterium]